MNTGNITLSTSEKYKAPRRSIFSATTLTPSSDYTFNTISLSPGSIFEVTSSKFIYIVSNRPVSIQGTMTSIYISEGEHNSFTITGLYPDTTMEVIYGSSTS